ncbi:MAG: MBL fold metallo-hydrolase [Acidilobus sp.]
MLQASAAGTSSVKLATVLQNGAIDLGKNVVADSYDRRPIRVVTHAHEDHTRYLQRSASESLFIVATPTTHEFLNALGYQLPQSKVLALDYDKPFQFEDEQITLKPARHIAGSAQVVVETRQGTAAYTGDFKMPGTEPIRDVDVLVLDATYGSPHLTRKGTEWDAIGALVQIIEQKVKDAPVWIYGFNGKLQEIMVELRIRGIKERFLADPVTLRLAQIASRFYGVELGDVAIYTRDHAEPGVIIFAHTTKASSLKRMPGVHVILTGLERRGVSVQVEENVYRVAFSDHASFWEIIEYVKEAMPKEIIVDGSRGFDPQFTAKYLNKVLGIPARVEPVGAAEKPREES